MKKQEFAQITAELCDTCHVAFLDLYDHMKQSTTITDDQVGAVIVANELLSRLGADIEQAAIDYYDDQKRQRSN